MNAPSQPQSTSPAGTIPWTEVWRAMRPGQWTKNGVVLAAFFFGYWDRSQQLDVLDGLTRALPAALLFCLISSGMYLLNDVRDRISDQAHPEKRHRPVAAGRLAPACAARLGALGLTIGLVAGWFLAPAFAGVAAAYVAIQLAYSFGLKHVALLDVFVIAAGFVLRAIAGAMVLDVAISPWLLLCTFLLALFLALCKRRQEKSAMETTNGMPATRASLAGYDTRLLEILIAITAAATIVAYCLYTLSESTVAKFGTSWLGFTIPFVIFGVFRYLDLVFRHDQGERPERILLTDGPLIVNLCAYGLTLLLIFLWHP